MDRWTLQINGAGEHHTKALGCVDEIASDFVAKLHAAGHTGVTAKLTCNAQEEMIAAKKAEAEPDTAAETPAAKSKKLPTTDKG